MARRPARRPPDLAPVLKDDVLYLGDNGRCLCGKHSGASARYTGRDISGQPVLAVDARIVRECARSSMLALLKCERPGCDVRPPALEDAR